jgi:hypothetical protein
MIVGLFVRFVFFIDVLIASCSALYFENWDLILLLPMLRTKRTKRVAMIVGLFVRVLLSIDVMIACCSAMYIEDWDLILLLVLRSFVTIANPTLSSFSDPFV